jgi:RHS repeat-associated protein
MKIAQRVVLLSSVMVGVAALVFFSEHTPGTSQVAAVRTIPDSTPVFNPLFDRPFVAVEQLPLDATHQDWLQDVVAAGQEAIRQGVLKKDDPIVTRRAVAKAEVASFEEYLGAHPESAWTPSILAQLGKYYERRGQKSLAIARWESALEMTKDAEEGNGKAVADYVLANWTRLLANVGQWEKLEAAYQLWGDRILDGGVLSRVWLSTQERYAVALQNPQQGKQCGLEALVQVALRLGEAGKVAGGQLKWEPLHSVAVQADGMSLAQLQDLAGKAGLRMAAVALAPEAELVVPSVVHWKLAHYSSILSKRGDWYEVMDPSEGGRLWLTAEEIKAEASGYYLVPSEAVKLGVMPVGVVEAGQVWGRTSPAGMPQDAYANPGDGTCETGGDAESTGSTPEYQVNNFAPMPQDIPKPQPTIDPPPFPKTVITPGTSTSTCSGGTCSTTKGMVRYSVSEPYLSLVFSDVPTSYQPSKGPDVTLRLCYDQRNLNFGSDAGRFSFGSGWSFNWLAYATVPNSGSPWEAVTIYRPGGGRREFTFPVDSDTATDYRDNTRVTYVDDASGFRYVLTTPGGGTEVYSVVRDVLATDETQYYLSSIKDPQGNGLTFNYTVNYGAQTIRLTSVVDADNRSTSISYVSSSSQLIDHIQGPFVTNLVALRYSSSLMLTNIQDVVGISSGIQYDGQGQVTTLTTPYGTTTFALGGVSGFVTRSVVIGRPDGTREAYALVLNYPNTDFVDFTSAQIPSLGIADTLDTATRRYQNTYYWDAANFQELAGSYGTNIANYGWQQLKHARIRHWLQERDVEATTDTLGWEQQPSPDTATTTGARDGLITWYDHTGKDMGDERRGTQRAPSRVAKVMPDGTTWWMGYQRNTWGAVTNATEHWYEGGTAYTRTHSYIYSDNGEGLDLLRHIEPDNTVSELYTYGTHPHRPDTIRTPVGLTSFTYDSSHRVLTGTSPSGMVTTYTYDSSSGYPLYAVDSDSGGPLRTNAFTWLNGRVRTQTDPRGLSVTYTFDALGRMTLADYSSSTVQYVYTNGAGAMLLDPTGYKDALGNWTYSAYDGLRRKTQIIDARGNITAYGYCDCGGLSYVTNAWNDSSLREVTHLVYDNAGRVTQVYYPDGKSVTNVYNALNRRIIVGDGLGYLTNTFNNLGLLSAVSNSFGRVQSIVYNVEDLPIQITDANGVLVTNLYDSAKRLRTRTYPDGGIEAYGYSTNLAGPTSYTNQITNVVFYGYSSSGQKTNEISGTSLSGSFVSWMTNGFFYTSGGDLKLLVDGNRRTTTWVYDQNGWVTNKTDANSTIILTNAYYANGLLSKRWSKAKGLTQYGYDQVGNLTNVNYPSSTDLRYAYNSLNRITNMVDAAGTTKYTYHTGGMLATEGGLWSNDTVTYSYHPLVSGLLTNVTVSQLTQNYSATYGYDAAKRMSTVTSTAGNFSYLYTNVSGLKTSGRLVAKLTEGSAVYVTNAFDTQGRMLNTSFKTTANVLLNSHGYVYNKASQRTQMTRSDSSTVTYSYDPLGEVTKALGSGGLSTENLGYGYDTGWNLTVRTNGGSTASFTINALNQVTLGAGLTYTYDNNGNMSTESGYRNFSYDDENQLTSVYMSGGYWKHEFQYDGRGRLRKVTDYTWSSPNYVYAGETRYIYAGMRVLQERNSGNTPTVSYVRGIDLSGSLEGAGGIGGLLARSSGYSSGSWTTHHFYHSDGNGNVVNLTDANAGVVATYRYDPFGKSTYSGGTLASANVYRFSSKQWIPDVNVYYYGYRFYDPNLQRWPNRDPIQEKGGINLYSFVKNSPLAKVDPKGHCIFRMYAIYKCKRAVEKWAAKCVADFPDCEDSIWDDEYGFLRATCYEKRHEMIGECAKNAKDMILECSKSSGGYTPPVRFPWQDLLDQYKKKPGRDGE